VFWLFLWYTTRTLLRKVYAGNGDTAIVIAEAMYQKRFMDPIAILARRAASKSPLPAPVGESGLRDRAYALIKSAIADTNIYEPNQELCSNERRLTMALGITGTPLREALALLRQEGLIRVLPPDDILVTRKSKREIIEMIQMWAALESMAARLASLHAADGQIAEVRRLFESFQGLAADRLRESSDLDVSFHSAIIVIGGSQVIIDATRSLLSHVRAIRRLTITHRNRGVRALREHRAIIEALERRDPELAERLTRQHNLDLAAHVETLSEF
jgi:DNA-binding GntR family transcriptional regulator